VPLATFLLLSMAWFALTATKINICVQSGIDACR